MELTRMNKIVMIWLTILILAATVGYFIWRHYNNIGADTVKSTTTIPTTVSFFGKISSENNSVPLNKIMVYAGGVGALARSNGEFNLQLSRSTWLVGTNKYGSEIAVSFVNTLTGQKFAPKGSSEPFTLHLPPEWATSASAVPSYPSTYVPSPYFSVKADFVLAQ